MENKIRLSDNIRLTLANVNFHQDKMSEEQKNDVSSFLTQIFTKAESRVASIMVRDYDTKDYFYNREELRFSINRHFVDDLCKYLLDEGFFIAKREFEENFGVNEIVVALNGEDFRAYNDLDLFNKI